MKFKIGDKVVVWMSGIETEIVSIKGEVYRIKKEDHKKISNGCNCYFEHELKTLEEMKQGI